MTILYNQTLYNQIKKQKNKLLTVYFILLSITVLLTVGIIIFYALQPYGNNYKNSLKYLMFAIVICFSFFSGVYLSIVYGRVSKYFYFLNSLKVGKKYTFAATVVCVNYGDTKTNYGVDFYTLEVLEWSDSQKDYVNHKIFIDAEFKNLDINEGDMLTITTSLNTLMEFKKV